MHIRVGVVAAAILFSSTAALGQRLSYGVVAGTALTDDFNALYIPYVGFPPTIEKSGGKGVIIGPKLEWRFTPHFSVEGDALFRELRFEDAYEGAHNPTVTWEFPILAKYRLLSGRVGRFGLRPFVAAGPSFRTTGNLNANPSHAGISAGGGLEFRVHRFSIAPELRYTRWAQDSHPYGIRTRADQLELLVDFSESSSSDARPFGRRFSLGAVLGVNLLGDYNPTSSSGFDATSGTEDTFSSRSGPRSFLVGPEAEFSLTRDLSVEVDAIYRPIRGHTTYSGVFGGQPSQGSSDYSFVTWQFPLLAKYKLPIPVFGHRLKSFVEAGPSFRIPDSVTRYGFTAGGGVSVRLGPLSLAPGIRYTRWQADPFTGVKANEADLLVGVTF